MSLKMNNIPFTGQFKIKNKFANIIDKPNIYVGEYTNSGTIYKFDNDNNELWTFNNHTGSISGLAKDNSHLYSVSYGDDTAKKIDTNGNEIWTFTENTSPRCICVDPNGNSYNGGVYIFKLDSNGNKLWQSSYISNNCHSVCIDNNLNVYGGIGDGSIKKIDTNGNELWSYSIFNNITYIVRTDKQNNIYTGDSAGNLKKLDGDGNELWSVSPKHNDAIRFLALDNKGYIYTTSDDKTVKKNDGLGNTVWSFTTLGKNYSVYVDQVDNVYVTAMDFTDDNAYIYKLNSEGQKIWRKDMLNNDIRYGLAIESGIYPIFWG
ncbi:hypothetical protein PBI_SCTP2_69 [Salicola phage SCTP-2]|nr:hypothetical protein PBI_SCTP2_69 [Salicola phage SCTP-2]